MDDLLLMIHHSAALRMPAQAFQAERGAQSPKMVRDSLASVSGATVPFLCCLLVALCPGAGLLMQALVCSRQHTTYP